VETYIAQARWVADHILNNFLAATQATPASAEEHPPSEEHRQAASLPHISGYTRRGDAAGQARLRLCLHSFIEVFAELLLRPVQYMLRRRESSTGKAGDANARILFPPPSKAESSSGYFPLPGCRKCPKISPSTPSHQPNISQTPSGRMISGCLHSVCLLSWHDFQPMLSSFLPFFHPQCSIPQHVQK
jgi:hypothetical protein